MERKTPNNHPLTILVSYTGLVLSTIFLTRTLGVLLFFLIDPLLAVFLNLVLDAADGPIYKYLLKIPPLRAQFYDKLLDYFYYLGLLVLVFRFNLPYQALLLSLFLYRTLGQTIFFLNRDRRTLVFFPAFFDAAVVALLAVRQFNLEAWLGSAVFTAALAAGILVFKVWHEIFLHLQEKSFFVSFWLPIFRFLRLPVLSKIKP